VKKLILSSLIKERYRRGVGMMIINSKKEIFLGQRFDKDKSAWQMPQGGIDRGENELAALKREMFEETGIKKDYKIIFKSNKYFYYKLPQYLQKKLWKGRFVGQKQKWFLLEYFGDDKNINIKTKKPEFKKWRWTPKEKMLKLIVPFKRKLYREIVREFSEFL
tara:strand:+ start:1636 stop:2124 length:489 start_codon:yes stop_codon:yes gene_type:complete